MEYTRTLKRKEDPSVAPVACHEIDSKFNSFDTLQVEMKKIFPAIIREVIRLDPSAKKETRQKLQSR